MGGVSEAEIWCWSLPAGSCGCGHTRLRGIGRDKGGYSGGESGMLGAAALARDEDEEYVLGVSATR